MSQTVISPFRPIIAIIQFRLSLVSIRSLSVVTCLCSNIKRPATTEINRKRQCRWDRINPISTTENDRKRHNSSHNESMVRAKLLSLLKNFSYPETVFFPFLLLAHYSKKYEQIKLKKELLVNGRHFDFLVDYY